VIDVYAARRSRTSRALPRGLAEAVVRRGQVPPLVLSKDELLSIHRAMLPTRSSFNAIWCSVRPACLGLDLVS
jgi:hypothetical protein